jgi:hypothetical protein
MVLLRSCDFAAAVRRVIRLQARAHAEEACAAWGARVHDSAGAQGVSKRAALRFV